MVISFTPVRQNPEVLKLFLQRLNVQGCESWFYDDNDNEKSTLQLQDWTVLPPTGIANTTDYRRGVISHTWSGNSVSRVAGMKNYAIDQFLKTDASHLFLVDSDVILLPGTVDHLLELDVPVVSSVYWSRWQPTQPYMPNVWDSGHYDFHSGASLTRLAEPGHYEVGGLGACTLIERSVLERVRFDPVPNFPMWGEDRWFCMRAGVLGIPLLADACLTPWHVYRDTDLPTGQGWSVTAAEAWKSEHLGPKWAAQFR